MHRLKQDCRVEERIGMRGGDGRVEIAHFFDEKNEFKSRPRMFAELTLPVGSSIGFHRHENEEELFYVVRGVARMDDDGETVELHAGDSILTGAGAGHAVKNVGGSELVLLAAILPIADEKP